MRNIRKHFKNLTDENLHGLLQAAIKDTSNEAQCIKYMVMVEMEYRADAAIRKALKQLGVTGTMTTRWVTDDRIAVDIDGNYFGIWDTQRGTFVD